MVKVKWWKRPLSAIELRKSDHADCKKGLEQTHRATVLNAYGHSRARLHVLNSVNCVKSPLKRLGGWVLCRTFVVCSGQARKFLTQLPTFFKNHEFHEYDE